MAASQAEFSQLATLVANVSARLEGAVLEIQKVATVQAATAPETTPWAGWVTERLTEQQTRSDEAIRGVQQMYVDAKIALDDIRGKLAEV